MRRLAAAGRVEALNPDDSRAEAGDLSYLDENRARWSQAIHH